jgi:16S rRNA (guanine527-N7)-methyltransferase
MSKDRTESITMILADVAPALGGVDIERLTTLLTELIRWNPQLGLVSKHNTVEVTERLIKRSAHLWRFFEDHAGLSLGGREKPLRVADIGSGGGFPGLLWKLLEPDLDMTLIERKERKAAYLDRVILRMGLDGATVLSADLADVAKDTAKRETYDLVTLMAVGDPADFAAPIESVLKPAGFLCAVRGRDQAEPPARIGERLRRVRHDDRKDGRYVLYQKS